MTDDKISAPKTRTEREYVLAQREATFRERQRWYNGDANGNWEVVVRAEIARLYPLPPVTRPRVETAKDVTGTQYEYRCVEGRVEIRQAEKGEWLQFLYTNAELDAIESVRHHPTEIVHDES